MILLFVFSQLVVSKSRSTQIAGTVLLWAVLLFFVTFLVFTVTAFADEWPRPWAIFLAITPNAAPAENTHERTSDGTIAIVQCNSPFPPPSLHECEEHRADNGEIFEAVCGTWMYTGNKGFTAAWEHHAQADITIENSADKTFRFVRADSGVGSGTTAIYTGRAAPLPEQACRIAGEVQWTYRGKITAGTWSGSWQ